jgi:secreted trypsin-like serine protease
MAPDCEPPPPDPSPEPEPPPKVSDYCYGNDYSIWSAIKYRYGTDGVSGAIDAILQGEHSEDRRATVWVRFGQSYCSGIALSKNTVLTAGHCGYGETTQHDIYIAPNGTKYHSSQKLVHPDYVKYTQTGGAENRKADLMLLYMDTPLPPPYVSTIYSSANAAACKGLVAQGYGKWEQPELDLRETKYVITQETQKLLNSMAAPDSGKVCFGDSGGPLYADVGGLPQLAGITSTTMSSDCLVGGSHVNVNYFKDWVTQNMR